MEEREGHSLDWYIPYGQSVPTLRLGTQWHWNWKKGMFSHLAFCSKPFRFPISQRRNTQVFSWPRRLLPDLALSYLSDFTAWFTAALPSLIIHLSYIQPLHFRTRVLYRTSDQKALHKVCMYLTPLNSCLNTTWAERPSLYTLKTPHFPFSVFFSCFFHRVFSITRHHIHLLKYLLHQSESRDGRKNVCFAHCYFINT